MRPRDVQPSTLFPFLAGSCEAIHRRPQDATKMVVQSAVEKCNKKVKFSGEKFRLLFLCPEAARATYFIR